MIPADMTSQLAEQFRDRRADVVELPHPGGHGIDPAVLPPISTIICRPERFWDRIPDRRRRLLTDGSGTGMVS